jgi:hypothetical protein
MAKQTKHETNRKMITTKELIIADITAKVEAKLASQKVNLSLVDDLIKKFESVKNTEARIISEIRKAGVIVDKGENDFKNLLKLLDTMEKDADVLLKQAKDLGVELPAPVNALIRQIGAYSSTAFNAVGQLEKASSIIYGVNAD